MSSPSPVLIVLEPRLFLAESIVASLRHRRLFSIVVADNLHTALEAAASKPNVMKIFVVCGVSFLKMEMLVDSLRSRFPEAKVVLMDEQVRHGCCFVVEYVAIQGYCTLLDSQKSFNTVLDNVVKGTPHAAPSVERFFSVDTDRQRLCCRKGLQDSFPLHSLSKKEWICFKHFVNGGEVPELAKKLHLQERTVSNLKYRLLKKLSLTRTADLFPLASQWGFSIPDFEENAS